MGKSIFERMIAVVSPERALKREGAKRQLQVINSGYGYYGASKSKKAMKGWQTGNGAIKEDIYDNLQTLRERSRDLYMGAPIAVSAIKTCRTNVVGSGLRLKSQLDAELLGISDREAREREKQIEREFALWAESGECDNERIDNFYELQQLAFLNWLLSGDVLVTLPVKNNRSTPYTLCINLIEADRCCNKDKAADTDNISGGVEYDDTGEITAYWIASSHPYSSNSTKQLTWTRVPAFGKESGRRNVLHLMSRERIGQVRGIPYLAPVIEALKQIARYTDAELTAAVIAGYFSVFIERPELSSESPFGEDEGIGDESQVDTDSSSIELAPGAIIDLQDGEKASSVTPGRPNTAFDGFVNALCKQIGAALEIPREVLMKEFTSSYSASRGALLEAFKMFRMYRSWLARDFCQPIFEEWFSEAVAIGRIDAPGFFSDELTRKAWCSCEWNGPTQGQLDPLKEVKAAVVRVDNGFSTRDRETQELTGGDFYKNAAQKKREDEALAIMKEVNDGGDNT